jgi:hypothetical protein
MSRAAAPPMGRKCSNTSGAGVIINGGG